MLTMMRQQGINSGHMFAAGMASIGLSVVSWVASLNAENSTARADRWGIFVGEWAPSFFALGVALRIEETQESKKPR
ncbi:hypothetical protein LY13_002023 [Prauserella aidingensis]|nr:hypothetical protein [Prauserella aidingensis]